MRVLVIEDDPSQRQFIVNALRQLAIETAEAGTVAEARIAIQNFDVAVADYVLPDGTARDLAGLGIPIVVLSVHDVPPDHKPWSGAWLRKPVHLEDLTAAVTTAIARKGE